MMDNAQRKHISVEVEDGVTVVTCLDSKMESDIASNDWNLEVSEVIDKITERRLVIDFRKVDLVTSRVMGYLLSVKFLSEKKGIPLALCGFNAYIAKAMSLTNLDSVFLIAKNRAGAIEALKGK